MSESCGITVVVHGKNFVSLFFTVRACSGSGFSNEKAGGWHDQAVGCDAALAMADLLLVLRPVIQASWCAARDNRARQARDNARYALNDATRKKESEGKELRQLFDVAWYGTEGEWKKLQNVCIEKEVGEYVYELCFFGSAAQKNENGGSTSLGSFSSWNTKAGVAPGSPEYYAVQMYTGGQLCWNGPERRVTLKLECGSLVGHIDSLASRQ